MLSTPKSDLGLAPLYSSANQTSSLFSLPFALLDAVLRREAELSLSGLLEPQLLS